MARERRNAEESRGERVRRRLRDRPELELTEEELRSLADEGIDPEEVRRLARSGRDREEASEHDRDTPRDQIEGMIGEVDEEY